MESDSFLHQSNNLIMRIFGLYRVFAFLCGSAISPVQQRLSWAKELGAIVNTNNRTNNCLGLTDFMDLSILPA